MLKQLRLNKGLTQRDVAKSVGTSEMILSLIESGKVLPTYETALKLANTLGCELASIYTQKERKALKTEIKTNNGKYNLHGRLDKFDKEIIKRNGYRSINSWLNDCYKKLEETK